MALLSQYFVMMCVFVLAVHGEKRLLLSDPDVVNNRLLQMEKEIQKLTSKMADNKLNHLQQLTRQSTGKIVLEYLEDKHEALQLDIYFTFEVKLK
jgi:flagellar biosynthesis/type III secretory pathway protein FliH